MKEKNEGREDVKRGRIEEEEDESSLFVLMYHVFPSVRVTRYPSTVTRHL